MACNKQASSSFTSTLVLHWWTRRFSATPYNDNLSSWHDVLNGLGTDSIYLVHLSSIQRSCRRWLNQIALPRILIVLVLVLTTKNAILTADSTTSWTASGQAFRGKWNPSNVLGMCIRKFKERCLPIFSSKRTNNVLFATTLLGALFSCLLSLQFVCNPTGKEKISRQWALDKRMPLFKESNQETLREVQAESGLLYGEKVLQIERCFPNSNRSRVLSWCVSRALLAYNRDPRRPIRLRSHLWRGNNQGFCANMSRTMIDG